MYTRQFPSTHKGSWAGHPALFPDNDVKILFDKVDEPPPHLPQSAIWHFGWHVTDTQQTVPEFHDAPRGEDAAALYEGRGRLGADHQRHLAERRQQRSAAPRRRSPRRRRRTSSRPGSAALPIWPAPEDALFEIAGNYPAERFNHVHMWHEHPFCALIWYKKHLNAPVRPGFPDTS